MPNVGATSLGAMKLAAQQRADMQNSAFISDSEWTAMVNSSCQALYEKMVEAYGNDYWVQTPYSITTDGTNYQYALPTDFFKLLGVDLKLAQANTQGTGWITIWRYNFAQRNQYTLPNIQTLWGRTNLKYRLIGSNLSFIPTPAANQTLQLWYAPRFVPLVNAGDSFDAINGWEEWVINHAAMKARVKEESPVDGLQILLAIEEERLNHVAENRDASSPAVTVDVYRVNGWGESGSDFGGEWSP